jgi:hypothetical protein
MALSRYFEKLEEKDKNVFPELMPMGKNKTRK